MLTVRSQVAIYATVFLSCTSFSTVMPTLWPYVRTMGASAQFLGVVVAIYSVGEAVGALTFAPVLRRASARSVQASAMGVGVLASGLFVAASAVRPMCVARWVVLGARFLHGIWTGASQAVQQAYLADVVGAADPDALTRCVVAINAFASLGFVCGPLFGFLAALLPPVVVVPQRVVFDPVSAPGYAVLFASLICLVLYLAVFDEHADRAAVHAHIHEPLSNYAPPTHAQSVEEAAPILYSKSATPDSALMSSLIFCNAAFFAHFYGFAIQETITTPFVQQLYAWSVRDANALFIAAGVISLAAFIVLHALSSRIDDRFFVLASFAFAACGHALLVPISSAISLPRFLAGFTLLSLAFPFGRASCVSLYTKILPLPSQPIGQAVLLAVGALARILGPFPAAAAISSSRAAVVVFSTTAAAFVLAAALQLAMFRRLRTKPY